MAVKCEITVSRVFDYQKVEVKVISDDVMELSDVNAIRQEVAKLGDEALRELKLSHTIEKERDKYFRELAELEEYIAAFPVIAEGENAGLIDVSQLTSAEKKDLSKYKKVRDLLSLTESYNYSDNQTSGIQNVKSK